LRFLLGKHSADCVSGSAGQQVSRSAGQQVSKSASQQVSESASQQVSESAAQRSLLDLRRRCKEPAREMPRERSQRSLAAGQSAGLGHARVDNFIQAFIASGGMADAVSEWAFFAAAGATVHAATAFELLLLAARSDSSCSASARNSLHTCTGTRWNSVISTGSNWRRVHLAISSTASGKLCAGR